MSLLSSISFRTKIALLVGALVIVTGAFGTVVTREILVGALKKGLEERGLAIATSLAARSADPILQGRFFDLHTIIQEARTSTTTTDLRYVFVVDPRGNLVDHTFEEGFPSDLLDLAQPAPGQVYVVELLETESELIRDIAVPILDGRAGVLHVGISQKSMDAAIAQAQLDLLLAAGIALIAGISVSWLLAALVTKPILQLVKVAEAVRDGNLLQRARIDTMDEVGRLGSAFDAMTEQLVARIRDLEITTGQVSTLNRIAVLTSKTADLDWMFNEMLGKVLELLDADAGAVLILDEQGKRMECKTQQGLSRAYVGCLESITLSEENRVLTGDGEISLALLSGVEHELKSLAHSDGLQAWVSTLFCVKGKVRGALHVARSGQRDFSARESEVLSGVASQIGIALENLELINEANQAATLRQLNQMKSEFIVRASHELRTPVTAIKGYVETLLRPDMGLSRSEERQLLEDINDVSDRLIRLVQDLLNVSRLESGRLVIKNERLALHPLMQKVARRHARQSGRHQLKLRIEKDVREVVGDSDRIEDILDNLVSNAIKYSPKGGTITIRAANQSSSTGSRVTDGENGTDLVLEGRNWVTISVHDQGIGVPAEELPRLFQQFYQVSPILGVRTGGIGVGLYICKSYVEAMGGKIWAESQEGKGSTFCFTLPAASPPEKSSSWHFRSRFQIQSEPEVADYAEV